MFETLTTEVLLSLATAGASGLALCGMVVALRATQHEQVNVDIDAAVAAAPYRRLHNVLRQPQRQ